MYANLHKNVLMSRIFIKWLKYNNVCTTLPHLEQTAGKLQRMIQCSIYVNDAWLTNLWIMEIIAYPRKSVFFLWSVKLRIKNLNQPFLISLNI